MPIDVFKYTDYRKFLADWHAAAKADDPHLTYRMIADNVGYKSPAHFILIVKGRANVSKALALKFAAYLRLKRKATLYFVCMVHYNQSENHSDKKRFFEEMITFNRSVLQEVDRSEYAFYDRWYHAAVRVLVNFFPVKDNYRELGRMLIPAISPSEARKSITLLAGLDFIKADAQGFWRPTARFLTTGYEARSVAVNNFVLRTMALANDSIERFPKEKRNCSTLTVGVSEKTFETVQNELRDFRRRVFEIVGRDNADTVYQLSMQLFPVSKQYKEPGATK
jgi:uncharacterized protein (TIGR02147 family)